MTRTAKLFRNGRSQAVRLPSEFRFEGTEVFIHRDAATGNIVLSSRPDSWADFLKLRSEVRVPEEFLSERHDEPPQKRELL